MFKLQEKKSCANYDHNTKQSLFVEKNALCAIDTHNTEKSCVNHAPFNIDNAPSVHPIGALCMTEATGWQNILSS